MSKLDILLKVDASLEQIKYYVAGRKEKGDITFSSLTPREVNGYEDDRILKASFYIVDKYVTEDAKVKNYICLTSDNYLVFTTHIVKTVGVESKSEVFGLCSQDCFTKFGNLFKTLPEGLQSELIATEWLAHNPSSLGKKVDQVLNMTSNSLESKTKDLKLAEEMLVNAHHNMKKKPKELFTKVWKGEYFEKALKVMPWFKSCLDKGE